MGHGKVRDAAGGIDRLGRILTDQWDWLEADFARYYQLDLRHVCFGQPHQQLGARRLTALIHGLPLDSAFVRHNLAQQRSRPTLPVRPAAPKRTSTPEQIRRAGGRFVYAPKKEVTA